MDPPRDNHFESLKYDPKIDLNTKEVKTNIKHENTEGRI